MADADSAPKQELLSLAEAADLLCVSKSTMYRLLDQGKLRGMKAGKQWRFRKEDLLAYMQRGPAALALANLPIEVLDAELAALADELVAAGTSTAESDDPGLIGEEGKISQLVRRMVWLLHTCGGSDIHIEPVWEAGQTSVGFQLRCTSRWSLSGSSGQDCRRRSVPAHRRAVPGLHTGTHLCLCACPSCRPSMVNVWPFGFSPHTLPRYLSWALRILR
jgi:excisionase family DNA binding protein